MPELPEVETIRRQLDKVLVGQRIISLQDPFLRVEGKKILGVRRKAKMIIIELSDQSLEPSYLLIHLKMTGQLVYSSKYLVDSKYKYTRAIFALDKGKLFFNDLRKFGWIKLVTRDQLSELSEKLPPDVVDSNFTPEYLQKILFNSRRAVKLVLLDQQKMGGIGNIYANEILFCAGIDPRRSAQKISNNKLLISKLHKCIKRVINMGTKYGGSTTSDENFVNALGKPGKFQNYLKVYENKDKCKICKTKIKKIKLGGRGTYFCPTCQK